MQLTFQAIWFLYWFGDNGNSIGISPFIYSSLFNGREIMTKVKGFKENAARIAEKQGISEKQASAILAAATRKASASARKKNPRLNKVK